jgi:hypothetical protein
MQLWYDEIGELVEPERFANLQSIPQAVERHYTPNEIAELWNLDPKSVRQLFRNEGVLRIGRDRTTRLKRAYTTLRIPQSVMERVYSRMLKITAVA